MTNMVIYCYGFGFKYVSTIRGNLTSIAVVMEETDRLHPDEGLMLVHADWTHKFLELIPENAPVPNNVLVWGGVDHWREERIRERFPHIENGSVWVIEPFAWRYGIRSRRAVLVAEIEQSREAVEKYRRDEKMMGSEGGSARAAREYHEGKLQEAEAALAEFEKEGQTEEETFTLTLTWSQDRNGWVAECPELQCQGYGRTKERAKEELCHRIVNNATEFFWYRWIIPGMNDHKASLVFVHEDQLAEILKESEPALS